MSRLAKFARVVCYDRRDSGLSDSVKEDLTLESHAADALAVIDAAGLKRPVLFGSLDGARALTLLAATRPERVGGLIAMSPAVRGTAASNPELVNQGVDVVNRGVDLDNFPGEFGVFLAPGSRDDPMRWDKLTRYLQSCMYPGAGGTSGAPDADQRHRRRAPSDPDSDARPAPPRSEVRARRGRARFRRARPGRTLP